ncbi:MAG: hypothetical protein AAF802_08495 [Planctomycetota bacterium]
MKRQFTATEAGRVTGKGRSTITRHMKSGKLSFQLNEAGYRVVEASELMRVYGDDLKFEDGGGGSDGSNTKRGVSHITNDLEKLLDALNEASTREREQYAARIARLEKDFDEAKEEHRSTMRLLEDRSKKESHWQSVVRELESKQAASERELRALKKRLAAERATPWYRRIFQS